MEMEYFDPDSYKWDDLLTKVETDTANSGDEGVYLFKDKNFGTLYIRKGTEDPLMIVDESLTPVISTGKILGAVILIFLMYLPLKELMETTLTQILIFIS